ncbi:MAG: hypothetical protein NZM43_06180, partial [Saprospiraceae bacterium]|nr:hypothetical protein [Saprospiraceae bacterium]MDW8483898.1 hypothetical protein [Saprospiraceae bacterium]
MVDFPIDDLLDEDKSYAYLLTYFHGGHLCCPECKSTHYRVHTYRRKPIVQYMCLDCKTYFNLFSRTAFEGTHWPCSKVVMILRGFLKGESTRSMSREMKLGYRNLLYLRHRLMQHAYEHREQDALPDVEVESDEMYQNAGEKGIVHAVL